MRRGLRHEALKVEVKNLKVVHDGLLVVGKHAFRYSLEDGGSGEQKTWFPFLVPHAIYFTAKKLKKYLLFCSDGWSIEEEYSIMSITCLNREQLPNYQLTTRLAPLAQSSSIHHGRYTF